MHWYVDTAAESAIAVSLILLGERLKSNPMLKSNMQHNMYYFINVYIIFTYTYIFKG